MRKQIKALLKSWKGELGILLAAAPLWKSVYNFIDAWGNLRMIADALPDIRKFLDSTAGTFVIMAVGFGLIALQLYRQQRRAQPISETGATATVSTTTEQSPVVKECADRWLHDIADANKSSISRYVRVEKCLLERYDLLHTAPYVEFTFIIFNAAVYKISIAELIEGSVFFNTQILGKDVKMVSNSVTNCGYGYGARFTIRQWLSKEEVTCILNAQEGADEFLFDDLAVTVKGVPNYSEIEPQRLNLSETKLSSKPIREAYPKLKIDIQGHGIKRYVDFVDVTCDGSLINLRVVLLNRRATSITIKDIKLDVKASGKMLTVYAEEGEIYEDRYRDSAGAVAHKGAKLNNLNFRGAASITCEQEQPREGWLQFTLERILPTEIDGGKVTLILTDTSGEEHRVEYVALPPK